MNGQVTGRTSHTSLEFPIINGDKEACENEKMDKVTQIIPPHVVTNINNQQTKMVGKIKKKKRLNEDKDADQK